MDRDEPQVGLKFALIEAIMAETDMDLLDLISKILIVNDNQQAVEHPKAG